MHKFSWRCLLVSTRLQLRTFSLSTLLVGSSLAAIGLAIVGNRIIENNRQARLVDEALRASEVDEADLFSIGHADGSVQLWLASNLVSESTARKIAEATRIEQLWLENDATPAVRDILSSQFVQSENEYWLRKHLLAPSASGIIWERREGVKQKTNIKF